MDTASSPLINKVIATPHTPHQQKKKVVGHFN